MFVPVFLLATAANALAIVLPSPVQIELAVMAVPHLAFIAWMVMCDRAMRTQRAAELELVHMLVITLQAAGHTET